MVFVAETAANVATITDKLAACEQSIADAEFRLPNASLRLALGNAEPGDELVGPRLRELHAERDLLRSALEAAEQQEADRLAAAKQHELASTCRAATQHLARLEKELGAAAVHAANAQRAYERAVEAGRSALASMPTQLRAQHWMQLSAKWLQKLLLVETRQVGVRAGATVFLIPEFTAYSEHLKGWASGKVPTISQLLARDLTPIREKLKSLIPSSSGGSPFLPGEDAGASDFALTGASEAPAALIPTRLRDG
jgi:hypothetical protein